MQIDVFVSWGDTTSVRRVTITHLAVDVNEVIRTIASGETEVTQMFQTKGGNLIFDDDNGRQFIVGYFEVDDQRDCMSSLNVMFGFTVVGTPKQQASRRNPTKKIDADRIDSIEVEIAMVNFDGEIMDVPRSEPLNVPRPPGNAQIEYQVQNRRIADAMATLQPQSKPLILPKYEPIG